MANSSIEVQRETVQRIIGGLPTGSNQGAELIQAVLKTGDAGLLESLPDLLISIVENNFDSLPRFDSRSESVDLEMRCNLAIALGALGNRKAVEPLKRLLSYLRSNRRELKNSTNTNVRQEMGPAWDRWMEGYSLCMVNVLKGLISLGEINAAPTQLAISDLAADPQWVRGEQDWLRTVAVSPEFLLMELEDLLENTADEATLSDVASKLGLMREWSPTPRQSLIQAIALKQFDEAERIARAHPGDAFGLVLHPAMIVRLNGCVLIGKIGNEAMLDVLKLVGGQKEVVEAAENAISSIVARYGLHDPRVSDAWDPSEYWDALTPSRPVETVVPSPELLASFVKEAPRVAGRFKSPGKLEEFVGYMEDRNKLEAVRGLRAVTKCSVVEGSKVADEAQQALLRIRLRAALKTIGEPGSEPPAVAPSAQPKPACTVILKVAGRNKISVIKVVREVTSLGLNEARDLVDGAPSVLKSEIDREEAETIVKSLAEAGAEAEIK